MRLTHYNWLPKENQYDNVFRLPYEKLENDNTKYLLNLRDNMIKQGYEGLVIRSGDSEYELGKRSTSCAKMKTYKSIELKCIEIIKAKEKTKIAGKMAALVCIHNGKKIIVGSGFTDKEREEFSKNPPIGEWIEVKYTSENPSGYLREPIFLKIRQDIK